MEIGKMLYKCGLFAIFALIFPCVAASCAFAAVSLKAPDAAGKGNAFVAQAISDQPVKEVIFYWRGKSHAASASPHGQGSIASILLPVSLDEKAGHLELAASAGKGASARKEIKVLNVDRPVQKLSVDKKYVAPPKETQARIQRDREKVRQALRSNVAGRHWDVPLLRPVQGDVSSQFGLKRVFNGQLKGQHKGLDLRGPTGTPIRACADGAVALVDDLYYSGNTVYINHGEGVFSAYLHMSETDVKPGQQVRRGDVIGKVGATGRVTGPHLHLSIIAQGESVDPLPLLEKKHPSKKIASPGSGK